MVKFSLTYNKIHCIIRENDEKTMRKQYKNKKKSCGLCKPHKRGWVNRWSVKDKRDLLDGQKEIENYEKENITE
jgi:hypothetical protein